MPRICSNHAVPRIFPGKVKGERGAAFMPEALNFARGPPGSSKKLHLELQKKLHEKKSLRENVVLLRDEIPDTADAEFHSARTTSPPRTNRLRIRAAGDMHERGLRSAELVSVRQRRKLRHRRRETSSLLGSVSSRL